MLDKVLRQHLFGRSKCPSMPKQNGCGSHQKRNRWRDQNGCSNKVLAEKVNKNAGKRSFVNTLGPRRGTSIQGLHLNDLHPISYCNSTGLVNQEDLQAQDWEYQIEEQRPDVNNSPALKPFWRFRNLGMQHDVAWLDSETTML